MKRAILTIQGVYFLLTGIWPWVHMASFEALTGPKTDDWLVQTVGALAVASGGCILLGLRRGPDLGTARVALASAAAFALVDIVFVSRRVIRPVYLADAALELIFLSAAALLWREAVGRMHSGEHRT